MASDETLTGEALERRLSELLDVKYFDPPAEFVAQAHITDESVREQAQADPLGFWEAQAGALDWSQPGVGDRMDRP